MDFQKQSCIIVFNIAVFILFFQFVNQLPDLATEIDNALVAKGLRDNRYGFVGFGGSHAIFPHSHTIGGQLMVSASQLRVTFDKNLDTHDDTMTAIKMAAMYPFRTGVSKSIVVIPCSSCEPHLTR